MKILSRKKVSYSWAQAVQIAEHIRKKMNGLRERERYAAMVLLDAASALRPGELLALRLNDTDFKAVHYSRGRSLAEEGQDRPLQERSGLSNRSTPRR